MVEYRWAEERSDRAADLAAELVRLRVDVIVAWVGSAVRAAPNATRTIPIVMGAVADPVRSGLFASLARPGGNTTGPSMMTLDIAGKRLQLLREVIPGVSRVAFLLSGKTGRDFVEETQVAAQRLGVRIQPVVVEGPQQFEGAFAAVLKERAEALIVEPIFTPKRIVDFAARHRLPTISDYRSFPEAGALMSYHSCAQLAHE